jgi:hypothetical protein
MKNNKKYYKNGWIIAMNDIQYCRIRQALNGDSSLEQGYRDAVEFFDSRKAPKVAHKLGLVGQYEGFVGQKEFFHPCYA